ncbi:MAG TPA: hypothetical protein ENF41_03340 [Candidatus Bathyarchaeota archaeon]|nr:hypothetical protein [Candidatus Bathyarchaeota archaeon]
MELGRLVSVLAELRRPLRLEQRSGLVRRAFIDVFGSPPHMVGFERGRAFALSHYTLNSMSRELRESVEELVRAVCGQAELKSVEFMVVEEECDHRDWEHKIHRGENTTVIGFSKRYRGYKVIVEIITQKY